MNELTDREVEEFRDYRFVAYADVLGYGEILASERLTDARKMRYMWSIWEALLATYDLTSQVFRPVDKILFSDSLYLSAKSPSMLLSFVAHFFASLYDFYRTFPETWMPWLRCGIGYGWVLNVHDPTVAHGLRDPRDAFRNPVGTAVSAAYWVESKSKLKGMRALVPIGIADACKAECPVAPEVRHYLDSLGDDWPSAGRVDLGQGSVAILDVPWWRAMALMEGMSPSTDVWEAHGWQAGMLGDGKAGLSHYETTLNLIKADPLV